MVEFFFRAIGVREGWKDCQEIVFRIKTPKWVSAFLKNVDNRLIGGGILALAVAELTISPQ